MGIHNESGNRRLSPVPPLNQLIPQLLDLLTSTTDPERSFLPFKGSKDQVILLVNNLGGISELELGGIVAETRRALDTRGIVVHRLLSGSFMVSRLPTAVKPISRHLHLVDKPQHARLLHNSPSPSHLFCLLSHYCSATLASRRSCRRARMEMVLPCRPPFPTHRLTTTCRFAINRCKGCTRAQCRGHEGI